MTTTTLRCLLLTSEISEQLQLYAQEITRENVSRSYLEAFASRALRRCAELYAISREGIAAPVPQAQPASPAPNTAPSPRLRVVAAETVDAPPAVDCWNGGKD
jgi:hypothetical protein